jgi:NAD(P)-dependent dehydrogenase (short-subunit alcohol dehydrogenase family)
MAGIYPFAPALQMTEELWDKVLDINLKGLFFLICGSAFHDDAHDAFMTLPPYTRTREGETRQLGGVVRTSSGRAFAL